MKEKTLTSYPSIDKPWLKHYSKDVINAPLPESTIYEYLWESNKNHLNDNAIIYFGRKITYRELFENIDQAAKAFAAIGIKRNDVVIICTINTPEMVYSTYALNKIGAISAYEYPTLNDQEMCQVIDRLNAKTFVVLDLFIGKYRYACKSVENSIALSLSESMGTITKYIYNRNLTTDRDPHQ